MSGWKDLAELRALVLTAFEAAHSKGLPYWRQMSTAVLKNRLLQATGGRFNERDWGFRNMVEMVASMPDLLEVSEDRPYLLRLRAEEDDVSEAAIQVMGQRARVRADLWRGVMDYSAGHGWTWRDGNAVPAPPDSTDLLPTITPEELAEWRGAFAQNLPPDPPMTPEDLARVEAWRDHALTSYALPAQLRGKWNERLKVNVVERLTRWFAARGESPPADLLTATSAPQPRPHRPPKGLSGVRSFIEMCITAMTDEELGRLNIPAEVALRVSTARPDLFK
jgi:hypothetical protein